MATGLACLVLLAAPVLAEDAPVVLRTDGQTEGTPVGFSHRSFGSAKVVEMGTSRTTVREIGVARPPAKARVAKLASAASAVRPAAASTTRLAAASPPPRQTVTSADWTGATRVTSGFGVRYHPLLGIMRMHSGVDLAARTGTPVLATAEGRVSAAGWHGGYGQFVAIEHGNGYQTRYGHLSYIAVQQGQAVHRGDLVGYVGSTGMSTGPHLHYEVRQGGQALNPFGR